MTRRSKERKHQQWDICRNTRSQVVLSRKQSFLLESRGKTWLKKVQLSRTLASLSRPCTITWSLHLAPGKPVLSSLLPLILFQIFLYSRVFHLDSFSLSFSLILVSLQRFGSTWTLHTISKVITMCLFLNADLICHIVLCI